MKKDFRIVYAGTPDFAVPALSALLSAGYTVPCVYTQPDRPAGRGRKVQMSPVKQLALEHGLEVQQPQSLNGSDELIRLQSYNCDLMVVAAYGQILPKPILEAPVHGCFNIHASLLPHWRGAAPIQRAIENADAKTGVTIMQMNEGLDTGDMLHKVECDIGVNTTSIEMHNKLASMGAEALIETLEQLHNNKLNPVAQDDDSTSYAAKIEKAEAQIDWQQPAAKIHAKICAFNPWPVAQTLLDDDVLRIWKSEQGSKKVPDGFKPGQVVDTHGALNVATGDGVLCIHNIQLPGKKAMSVADVLNSREIAAGTTLG